MFCSATSAAREATPTSSSPRTPETGAASAMRRTQTAPQLPTPKCKTPETAPSGRQSRSIGAEGPDLPGFPGVVLGASFFPLRVDFGEDIVVPVRHIAAAGARIIVAQKALQPEAKSAHFPLDACGSCVVC